uniref:Uncharacterized protein n=1 Tax=Aegilops tauschii subsp. strangulata TaxID=200361 RepID=A0A453NIV8_AEGTS
LSILESIPDGMIDAPNNIGIMPWDSTNMILQVINQNLR